MAEVGRDVLVEHLVGNLDCSFHFAIANVKVRDEVLQHNLDVAGAWYSTTGLGELLVERLEVRQES